MKGSVVNIKTRHFLSSKEVKKLVEELKIRFGGSLDAFLGVKPQIERIVLDNNEELLAINKIVSFWKRGESYIPLLKLLIDRVVQLKTVVVDMGAVKFVTNGADVMRPGIRRIDPTIREGDVVVVVDENNARPLAVTQAKLDAPQMESTREGKVLKNLHTINDFLWEFSKEFGK
ncbi:MAG: PUA domain containing protein [Promethearchaeota archaeon CR_4]|nr:MAG: PUA domain containing protein [Candidatus Lokiarchaeota archaeon CR_4]